MKYNFVYHLQRFANKLTYSLRSCTVQCPPHALFSKCSQNCKRPLYAYHEQQGGSILYFPANIDKVEVFQACFCWSKVIVFPKNYFGPEKAGTLPFLNNKNSHRALRAHTAHRAHTAQICNEKNPHISNLDLTCLHATLHISGLTQKIRPTLN